MGKIGSVLIEVRFLDLIEKRDEVIIGNIHEILMLKNENGNKVLHVEIYVIFTDEEDRKGMVVDVIDLGDQNYVIVEEQEVVWEIVV